MIHISADQNLYKIKEYCPPSISLKLYDPSKGFPPLNGINGLLIRTVTLLNKETLKDIPEPLSFIGTGSSGTDHMDLEYLSSKGLSVVDAKGCNARSVAEYVMTALLLWREEQKPGVDFGKVGIIGVGAAGKAVSALLGKFDIECVLYDPPRANREAEFISSSLSEVLACDILSFHTPLTKTGKWPTYHWLGADKLQGNSFKLIINAARGGVIDEAALLAAHEAKRVQNYVIDVWENEPDFNPEISKNAFIATPHIAGYSEQAKINATRIICRKLAEHFSIEYPDHSSDEEIREEKLAHIQYSLKDLITRLHPILGYDKALRDLTDRPDKEFLFSNLRTEWPFRFEYPNLKIRKEILDAHPELRKLGVH